MFVPSLRTHNLRFSSCFSYCICSILVSAAKCLWLRNRFFSFVSNSTLNTYLATTKLRKIKRKTIHTHNSICHFDGLKTYTETSFNIMYLLTSSTSLFDTKQPLFIPLSALSFFSFFIISVQISYCQQLFYITLKTLFCTFSPAHHRPGLSLQRQDLDSNREGAEA
jgi:hypothetical protein